jgi:hypothetical protein
MIMSFGIALIFDILRQRFGFREFPESAVNVAAEYFRVEASSTSYMPPCETFAPNALSAPEKESAAFAAIADETIKTASLLKMDGELRRAQRDGENGPVAFRHRRPSAVSVTAAGISLWVWMSIFRS